VLYLNAYEIIGRILKKLRVEYWCLLRFDDGRNFNSKSSVMDLNRFLNLVDSILNLGFEFLGGHTDKGVSKRVNVYENLKNWLSGKREHVGFCNLYDVFFKVTSPSGILILNPECLIFIVGMSDPSEHISIQLTGISKSEKLWIKELSSKYKLEWFGEPKHPIFYRKCKLSVENVKKFCSDIFNLLEEAGYSEV